MSTPRAADSTATSTPRAPRRRLPKRAAQLFAVILLCLAFAAGWSVWRHYRIAAELDAALADLDRDHAGWRLADMEAGRPEVPDAENAAIVVRDTVARQPEVMPRLSNDVNWTAREPAEQLSADEIGRLQRRLPQMEAALQVARQLARYPKGRYPQGAAETGFWPEGQSNHSAVNVNTLLAFDILLRAQNDDMKGALTACRAMVNAGRSFGDEPDVAAPMHRVSTILNACQLAERILGQGQPDGDDLRELQAALEEEAKYPVFAAYSRTVRANLHEQLTAIEAGDAAATGVALKAKPTWFQQWASLPFRDRVRARHPRALALLTEAVAAADLPPHERAAAIRAIETKSDELSLWQETTYLRPALGMFEGMTRQRDATLRCLIAALAVERYRLRHGNWPTTLSDLTPAFLSAVPLDPENGEPLGYRRYADRVVVYSRMEKAGRSGEVPTAFNPDEPSPAGVGVAVHVYDAPHRRQPAQSRPPAMNPPLRIGVQ